MNKIQSTTLLPSFDSVSLTATTMRLLSSLLSLSTLASCTLGLQVVDVRRVVPSPLRPSTIAFASASPPSALQKRSKATRLHVASDSPIESKKSESANDTNLILVELNKLTKEFSDVQSTIQKNSQLYEEQLENYQEKVNSLSEEIKQQSAQLDTQKMQMESLLQQKQELEQLNQKSQSQQEDIKSTLQKDLESNQQEMETTQEQLQTLQKQFNDQNQELSSLKLDKEKLDKEKEDAVQRKQTLESQLEELTAKLDKSTEKTQTQLQQIKTLNTTIQQLESKAKNTIATSSSETKLTQDIINVKTKSYNEIEDMKRTFQSIDSENRKKIMELESALLSYEKEQKSLRQLTKLGIKRLWSILMLTKLRERL